MRVGDVGGDVVVAVVVDSVGTGVVVNILRWGCYVARGKTSEAYAHSFT